MRAVGKRYASSSPPVQPQLFATIRVTAIKEEAVIQRHVVMRMTNVIMIIIDQTSVRKKFMREAIILTIHTEGHCSIL